MALICKSPFDDIEDADTRRLKARAESIKIDVLQAYQNTAYEQYSDNDIVKYCAKRAGCDCMVARAILETTGYIQTKEQAAKEKAIEIAREKADKKLMDLFYQTMKYLPLTNEQRAIIENPVHSFSHSEKGYVYFDNKEKSLEIYVNDGKIVEKTFAKWDSSSSDRGDDFGYAHGTDFEGGEW